MNDLKTSDTIRYLSRKEIEVDKWNACIVNADNALIYARAFYLDHIARHWDALVMGDYEAVMPLTWNKKYGFYYLYEPHFTPSLGVFGKAVSGLLVNEFIQAIPGKFKYWDIDLNENNQFLTGRPDQHIQTRSRINQLLNLDTPYEDIRSGYKRLCRRMIKQAGMAQIQVVSDATPGDVITFYREAYGERHPGIPAAAYDGIVKAATSAFHQGNAKAYLAKLPTGAVAAAYLVFRDERFIYSVIGGSTEKGKQTGAFYLLTNAAIREHAESRRIFRFEGSDLPRIAFFNAQFGAHPHHYLHLHVNVLPFPFNVLKKLQGLRKVH